MTSRYLQTLTAITTKRDFRLIHDDNISEMSFELPAVRNEIPIHLLITDEALHTGSTCC